MSQHPPEKPSSNDAQISDNVQEPAVSPTWESNPATVETLDGLEGQSRRRSSLSTGNVKTLESGLIEAKVADSVMIEEEGNPVSEMLLDESNTQEKLRTSSISASPHGNSNIVQDVQGDHKFNLIPDPVQDGNSGVSLKRRVGKRYRVNRMGVVLYKGHKSYALMRNVQMSIRTMVDTIESKPVRLLTPDDFKQSVKFQFPRYIHYSYSILKIFCNFCSSLSNTHTLAYTCACRRGSDRTPPHQFVDFQFKDYCPMVFRTIRHMYGADHMTYMDSICGDDSLSMLGTPGKSGALFFYSHDMKFVLKTVTRKESKFLRSVLQYYHHHITTYPNSLLTRFLGLHRIRPKGGKNVRFVAMNNVFMTSLPIHERYDLKGSTVGRMATEKEKMSPVCIFKDLDISTHVNLGQPVTRLLLEQMTLDADFLKSQSIMDYSLLLGVHYGSDDDGEPECDETGEEEEDRLGNDHNVGGRYDNDSGHKGDNASEKLQNNNDAEVVSTVMNRQMERGPSPLELIKTKGLFQQYKGGTKSADKAGVGAVYFVGIIDILQQWDAKKQIEQLVKTMRYEKTDISVAEPSLYAKRFMGFMKKIFVSDDEDEGVVAPVIVSAQLPDMNLMVRTTNIGAIISKAVPLESLSHLSSKLPRTDGNQSGTSDRVTDDTPLGMVEEKQLQDKEVPHC